MNFFGQIDNFLAVIVTFNGHLKFQKYIGIIISLQRKGAKKINVSLPAKINPVSARINTCQMTDTVFENIIATIKMRNNFYHPLKMAILDFYLLLPI